ncbi:hypothetical protein PVBG_06270 [Plasmodium vivax Brazil I]|uniref:Variable surface protein Vir4 n=1 Tax=Plasmodium vivax (strain Brazil I) TaxID=1033975 RepID=A0A0J9SJW1_PLAV1|nr:hypothetical protein PVBG_06270 [Plasmodium vivax Brazil I]
MVIKSLGLPSDEFYEKLNHDKEKNLSDYYGECSSFSSIKKNKGLRRPCAMVLKYLAKSNKKSEKVNSAYDDCILLNYWIYGKIYEQLRDFSKSAESFGELQILWNSLVLNSSKTLYYEKCEPHFHIVMERDWKKRKELYDYCVDYDTISGMNAFYDNHCKEFYMYLKEKYVLYKEYSKHCTRADNNMCPAFFSKCKNKDPNTLLTQLPCYRVMQSQEALSLKKEGPAPAEPVRDLTEVKTDLPVDPQIDREETNPVTKSGNILLGVVVTSMTSGALYKVKTDFIITY